MWQSSNTIRTGQMLHIVLCCLEGSTMSNLVHQRRRCARKVTNMILLPGGQYARGQVLLSNTDSTDRTDECPMAIKEIKKFVPFPRLTPLQPDAYAHPRKRASLSAPPHPSGLPAGRRKASNQNSCRRQYKMSLFGGYGRLPQTYGEPILWRTALQAEVTH